MTGSYPEKGIAGRLKDLPRQLPWRTKRAKGRANLLYLRAKGPEHKGLSQDLSGAIYTLGGVTLGLLGGYLAYHYRLAGAFFSVHQTVLPLLVAPALLGGAVGAIIAWWRARTRLAQALVTSEGFRQRLMSVERNQALWISLSAVLHDVRNPLHNIHLLVEHLEYPKANVEQVRQQISEQLDRINVRVRRVVAQISEFSGEICRRPISLASVLGEVSEMVKPLARQSHVNLVVNQAEDTQVVADPKFLVQAIDHLILNSLHILTEQPAVGGRSLWVQVQRSEEHIEMWIEDSGPGLPDEVRERLFEPLTTSRTRGMGLGLAIAHALASAAGAQLTLGHTGATGTRFVLRFQAA